MSDALFEELVREVDAEVARSFMIPAYLLRPAVTPSGLPLLLARMALDIDTVEVPVDAPVAPAKPAPEEKESLEDIKRRARKPPAEGPCRGCGKNLPLNRLMLCYRCWVNKENSKGGWREGQPHPETCGCDLDCRFDDKGADN